MGSTYYVEAAIGSDSNPGTESHPFKTIQNAVNNLNAGDTLLIRRGTYVEAVTISGSGTSNAPITIAAYPGERPVIDGQAGVDGLNSGLPTSGELNGTESQEGTGFRYTPLVSIEGSYIIFDGINITRSMGRGLQIYKNDAQTTGVIIRNCEISFSRKNGLMIEQGGNEILIEDCDISHSGIFAPYTRTSSELDWGGAVAVKGSHHVTIRRSHIHENWGEGFLSDSQTNGSSHLILSKCVFYDNMRPSIYLHAVNNVLVEKNLLYHSNNSEYQDITGIAITSAEPQYDVDIDTEDVTIVNNIIVGFDNNLGFWGPEGRYLRRVRVLFNTLIDARSVGIGESSTFQDCELTNNLVYQSNGRPLVNDESDFSGCSLSHNAWSTIPPENVSSDTDVIGDPLLASPNEPRERNNVDPHWYMLTEESPAINKGLTITGIEQDFYSNKRDSQPDMGSNEWVVETITADFSASPMQGPAPILVKFTNQSTATKPITSWFWDFGDGSISTAQNPEHEYTQGTFSVSLRVSTGTVTDIATKQDVISVQKAEINTPSRITNGLAVLYLFDEGSGEIVNDVAGAGTPLNLRITEPAKVSWLNPGLKIISPTILTSDGTAEKIYEACHTTNRISLEVWIKPENISQKGPARIASLSQNANSRNITLGQGLWGTLPADLIDVRLRTTERSANGMPSFSTPSGSLDLTLSHIVFTKDSSGTARIYIDGTIIAEDVIPGDFSTWNPRFLLLLGNEATKDYPWLGEIYLMAIYDRALTSSEVIMNRDAGLPVQKLAMTPKISLETFKRFVIISNAASLTNTKTLAYGVQYPDQRCVVCNNSETNGMTVYSNVNKAAAEYDSQKAVVKWLD